ncbi:hypothetical protein [Haloarchaeobius sp. HRN-SO-5]|uniref:hypothetical protein n=1 Tax=Haloarchaeobius sp. HRN-SO-5 TaxID=3446118 RepID=UPI003EBBA641
MSSPSLTERFVTRPFDLVSRSAPESVRMVAFWGAVSLPFLAVALLASGLDTGAKTLAFCTLLLCNLWALVVGKRYEP